MSDFFLVHEKFICANVEKKRDSLTGLSNETVSSLLSNGKWYRQWNWQSKGKKSMSILRTNSRMALQTFLFGFSSKWRHSQSLCKARRGHLSAISIPLLFHLFHPCSQMEVLFFMALNCWNKLLMEATRDDFRVSRFCWHG